MKRCYGINMRMAAALLIVAVLGCAVSARAATVAYWRFEGNNGSFVADGVSVPNSGMPIVDETGNHNVVVQGVTWQGDDAGELFGAAVPNPDPLDTDTNGTLNANGVNTRSLFFDHSSDRLVVADDDALDFAGAFTIEGYFRAATKDYNSILINKRPSAGVKIGYKVFLDAAGVLHLGVDNGPTWGRVGFDDYSLNDNNWHHFAAIRDGSNGLHIWVDGVEDLTPATNGNLTISGDLSNDEALLIGSDLVAVNSFDGYLDEIRLSDVALTSEQFLFIPSAHPPGDANRDGNVDGLDAAILASNWQKTGNATWGDGDFNGDQNVDDIDATIMATNWNADPGGGNVAVPEPASCVIIIVGLLTILLLRRTRNEEESCL